MNVGLVDQSGKRDTRIITLKPNDVQANAEFKIPTLPASPNQQTAQQSSPQLNQQASPQMSERQRAFVIPSLPSAPILQNRRPAPERQGAVINPLLPSNSSPQTPAINEARTETTNTFDQMTQAANNNKMARYSSFVR